ncbi:MAG: hypoxanthine-guanine phosphoribosyltransferase [Gammaproteobacteria bacterium]|nr:hypoxanthine-guanine phosphoribosyltransferase [Gammaproteobacteria bacterium]
MPVNVSKALDVYAHAECLYDQAAVEAALTRMAGEIADRLKGSNPLLLCTMTGGVVVTGHLLTRLDFPLQIDYLHATRYASSTQGGALQWNARPVTPLRDRTVLVVDDILDEGNTLAEILEYCKTEGAREVYSAVLANKLHDRKCDVHADFVGLTVPDRYVFGYGMDYKSYWRNAPGIFAVREEDI